MALAQVEFYLSGGVSNTDPALSLGGARSNTRLKSQTGIFQSSNITGVTFDDGYRNPEGLGTLKFIYATTSLRWTENGATEDTSGDQDVDASADGRYLVGGVDAEIGITIDVVAASLPVSDQQDDILIGNIANSIFSDVSVEQALVGVTQYRYLYAKNLLASELAIPLSSGSSDNYGVVSYYVAGILSNVPDILPDEFTQPGGQEYAVYSESDVVVAIDANGESGFWVKRTIASNTPFSELDRHSLGAG